MSKSQNTKSKTRVKSKALVQVTKVAESGAKLLNRLQSSLQMSIVPYERLSGYGIFVGIGGVLPNTQLSVGQAREAKRLGAVIHLADNYNGVHILAPSDVKRLNLKL